MKKLFEVSINFRDAARQYHIIHIPVFAGSYDDAVERIDADWSYLTEYEVRGVILKSGDMPLNVTDEVADDGSAHMVA